MIDGAEAPVVIEGSFVCVCVCVVVNFFVYW